MAIEPRSPAGQRDLEKGDVIHIDDQHPDFALAVEIGGETRVAIPRSGAVVRVRALPQYTVTRFDEIVGVDSTGAYHLFDRSGEVVVLERCEDGSLDVEKSFPVDVESLAEYIRWLPRENQRAWRRETMRTEFRDVLEGGEQVAE